MKKVSMKTLMQTIAVTLSVGILAGCGAASSTAPSSTPASGSASGSESVSAAGAPLFDEPVTLSMMVPSHDSFPYNPDWYVLDAIKRATNVTFDATPIPSGDYAKKVQLQIASGKLPDLMYLIKVSPAFEYGPQGAFVNLMDHLDEMPNFKAWMDKNPSRVAQFISSDGALYIAPEHGVEDTNRRGWLYREDILKELGLEVPTNQEEFYNMLVKMKEAYPDSYPLAFRSFTSGMRQLQQLAANFGTRFMDPNDNMLYYSYDYDTNDWFFGATSDEFKELVTFYNKLYEEGLLLPSFMTVDTAGWVEAMASGTSFVTYDYLNRITSLTKAGEETNSDFSINYMAPPAMGSKGKPVTTFSANGKYGFVVSALSKNLDQILKYIDWMYTDEAMELVSWGEEGVYADKLPDGTWKWLDDVLADGYDIRRELGMQNYGTYLRFDSQSQISQYEVSSPNLAHAYSATPAHELPDQPSLSYTEEERKIFDTIGSNVGTHVSEEISKFLLGKRDMSEWDAYVAEIEEMGLEQLKGIQISAYDRLQKALNK